MSANHIIFRYHFTRGGSTEERISNKMPTPIFGNLLNFIVLESSILNEFAFTQSKNEYVARKLSTNRTCNPFLVLFPVPFAYYLLALGVLIHMTVRMAVSCAKYPKE
jgi:choline-glycine betaine transporter